MRYFFFAIAAGIALALAGGATAGSSFNLHPAGFGPHSYAAWKAQQGTADDQGSANQSLYFQKQTTTPTNAAGVAVITGLEDLPLSELTGLSWWHREDGHCGAGAPRWNIGLQDDTGHRTTVFLGCNAALHSDTGVESNGFDWCQDVQPTPAATIAGLAHMSVSELTVTSLAIVFDEGNDTANPPPAGCAQEGLAGGFVYLDNIEVDANGVTHCWTSASDNGNATSTACGPGGTTGGGLLAPTLGTPTGVAVDPTDVALVSALNLAEPDVPLLSWLVYPGVY